MGAIRGQAEGDEDRNAAIFEKWAVYGLTHREIAKEYGVSTQRIQQIVADWRKNNPINREELAAQSIASLKDLRRRQIALAEQIKAGAPVAVGKDGFPLVEPGTDPPVYVRDYSGYLKALAEVRLTDAQIAKRMGLDAPDRLETTQTVVYEIAGLNPDDLK